MKSVSVIGSAWGLRSSKSVRGGSLAGNRPRGWYYRVIEEGEAEAGDALELLDRPLPEWSVRRVFGLIIGGDHKTDPDALPALANMELLFEGWRMRAAELMGD
jgi:MOSC domain-containing protein YiiM